jgi:4-hydroxy 2-oxovalerate aldolase
VNTTPQNKLKILDCTFRDGGYYNDWYFEPKTVQRYLSAMSSSGIDVVEIGFRMPSQNAFCGPFAYCTDEFLRTLELPTNLTVGVMINAKDFIASQKTTTDLIARSFSLASDSPIKMVRIAGHFREISQCEEVAKCLSDLGYQVGFNLMQSTDKTPQELAAAANQIGSWQCVQVLYFADSFGSMKPPQIREVVESLRDGWRGALGIHTHDNMGLALSNSLEALSNGITWIDSTVLGMGRGAGNTPTEHLLVELLGLGFPRYNAAPLFALVLEDFSNLKAKYQWGPNLLYYLSAAYNIHPTYVQELLVSNKRNSQHILDSLEYLKSSGLATGYDVRRLTKSLSGSMAGTKGSWQAGHLGASDDVLIIGPGAAGQEHKKAIEQLVASKNLTVLATNTAQIIDPKFITAHVACHHTKLMLDYDNYKALNRPVILPLSNLPTNVRGALQDVNVLDYGLTIDDESANIRVEQDHCQLNTNLVGGYAIAIAIASGAKRVLLAGFDGFASSDSRQAQMQLLLDQFKSSFPHVPIIAITPTLYSIRTGSPYAPDITP